MKSLIMCCVCFAALAAHAESEALTCAPKTWSEKWAVHRAKSRVADIVAKVNRSLNHLEVAFLNQYNQAHNAYATYSEELNQAGGLSDPKKAKKELADNLVIAADSAVIMAKISKQDSQIQLLQRADILREEALQVLNMSDVATASDVESFAGAILNELRLFTAAVLESKFAQALHQDPHRNDLARYDYRIYEPHIRIPIGEEKTLGSIMAQFDFVGDQNGFATGSVIAGAYTVKFAREPSGGEIIETESCDLHSSKGK